MNRKFRGWRLAAALVVAGALVAAGCGDDDDGGSASGQGGGGSELTKSPIKIGVPTAVTGSGGPSTKYGEGVAKAWQEWVNEEQGGINGHPVEVLVTDTKTEPPTALAQVRKMVETDGAIAIVSNDSTSDSTYVPYAVQQGVPVIGAIGYQPQIWGENGPPGVFPVVTTFPANIGGQVAAASSLGAKAFGVASCAESPACSQAEPLYAQLNPTVGIKFAGLVKVAFAQPNYTAECLQLIQRDTDFMQYSASGDLGKRMKNDCVRQGYDGFFGASGGTVVAEVFETEKDMRLAGYINGFPWWADDEPVKAFRDAMEKYNSGEEYRDPGSTALWSSLELIRKALADASDSPTTDELMDAMYALEDEDLDGLLPQSVTYTEGEGGPNIDCFWLYKMENGEFDNLDYGASGNSKTSGGLKSQCWPKK